MAQIANHSEPVPEGFERFQDFRKLKTRTVRRGFPLVIGDAMREINAAEPCRPTGRLQRRCGWNHRFQKGNAMGDAGTAEERAAGKVFLDRKAIDYPPD